MYLGIIGGSDGIRTRDLRRDRPDDRGSWIYKLLNTEPR